jgi:hypothetical protein
VPGVVAPFAAPAAVVLAPVVAVVSVEEHPTASATAIPAAANPVATRRGAVAPRNRRIEGEVGTGRVGSGSELFTQAVHPGGLQRPCGSLVGGL